MSLTNENSPLTGAKLTNAEIVIALGDALNNHDLETARTYLSDDLKFEGVFGGSMGVDNKIFSIRVVFDPGPLKK